MAEDSGRDIGRAHTDPVVDDAYLFSPGLLDRHIDLRGAGVERVFDQFLDHGGGTFDHLSRRDLIDQMLREDGYDAVVFGDRGHRVANPQIERASRRLAPTEQTV